MQLRRPVTVRTPSDSVQSAEGHVLGLNTSRHSLGVTNNPYPPAANGPVGRHRQPQGRPAGRCARPGPSAIRPPGKSASLRSYPTTQGTASAYSHQFHRHVAGLTPIPTTISEVLRDH